MKYVSISYAYPSSTNAERLGYGVAGCHYVVLYDSLTAVGKVASAGFSTAAHAYGAMLDMFPDVPVLPHDKPYISERLARENA